MNKFAGIIPMETDTYFANLDAKNQTSISSWKKLSDGIRENKSLLSEVVHAEQHSEKYKKAMQTADSSADVLLTNNGINKQGEKGNKNDLQLNFASYSQDEVEKYFTDLDNEHQIAMNLKRAEVMETKKKNINLLSEITSALGIWERDEKAEMLLIESSNAELASIDDIIRQAEAKGQEIKALALKNLQEQEEKLLYLQKKMNRSSEVCANEGRTES